MKFAVDRGLFFDRVLFLFHIIQELFSNGYMRAIYPVTDHELQIPFKCNNHSTKLDYLSCKVNIPLIDFVVAGTTDVPAMLACETSNFAAVCRTLQCRLIIPFWGAVRVIGGLH